MRLTCLFACVLFIFCGCALKRGMDDTIAHGIRRAAWGFDPDKEIPDFKSSPWKIDPRLTERWEQLFTFGDRENTFTLGYYREYSNRVAPNVKGRVYYPFFSQEPILMFWGVEGKKEWWAYRSQNGKWIRYTYEGWPSVQVFVDNKSPLKSIKKLSIVAFFEGKLLSEVENHGATP